MSLDKQIPPIEAVGLKTELDHIIERAVEAVPHTATTVPIIGSNKRRSLLGTTGNVDAKFLQNQTIPAQAGPSGLDRELENLVARVVEFTIVRLQTPPPKPFINSSECAVLIGVTPEHLCSMRARGEGPPWSGKGKWVRYQTRAVLEWLAGLPREKQRSNEGGTPSEFSCSLSTARRQ